MNGIVFLREASAAILAASLLVAACCDILWRVIPNECVACVAIAWLLDCGIGPHVAEGVLRGLGGAALVLVIMLAAARVGVALGRGPGIGGGDVKLLAAAGLWAGPAWGLALVAAACLLGVAVHGTRALVRRDGSWKEGIPLGPAIAICLAAFSLVSP